MVIEDSIVPRFPSESAPLLAMHRQLEEEAWELTDDFHDREPDPGFPRHRREMARPQSSRHTSVVFVHFLDFASEIGRPAPGEAARRGNLFGLIGLDPLAGLDPAVRQIEQTRLLAERMIYYMQRVPYVVNLQVDRMTSELLLRPEVRELLADTDRVSRSMERFAGVAEDLPATIARERQAIIDQFSNVLVAQEATLRPMLVELRQALEAGDGMAGSVDGVVKSIDTLLAHWPSPPPGAAGVTPGQAFRHHRVHAGGRRVHAHRERVAPAAHDARCPGSGALEHHWQYHRPWSLADRLPGTAGRGTDCGAHRRDTRRGPRIQIPRRADEGMNDSGWPPVGPAITRRRCSRSSH